MVLITITYAQMEQEQLTWRKLLGRIIGTPAEKQQLADLLGVNTITLTRWTNTRSKKAAEAEVRPRPRPHSLRQLVEVIPSIHREQMISLLQKEFPEFSVEESLSSLVANEVKEIPANFYSKVLSAAASLAGAFRFLTICDLILVHATQQLDPDRLGLSAILVQCVPPLPNEKVLSLREQFRIGTPPWRSEREERNLFLGSESLAGYAVTTCTPQIIDDLRFYSGLLPVHLTEYEVSVAVYPLLRAGRVAGSLLVSSTQPGYFTRARQELLQAYSDLAMTAFYDHECYDQAQIGLRMMPNASVQGPFLFVFNQRVEALLKEREITDRLQAEYHVLKQIEAELIYWYAAQHPKE